MLNAPPGCSEVNRRYVLEANLARHFSLLKVERENILWKANESVSFLKVYFVTILASTLLGSSELQSEVIFLKCVSETNLTNQIEQ